jgi:tRNA A37 threonylcarbamoyladenosine dehydratase
LRRDHGFARGEQRGKMHWGVRAVWSSEAQVFPWADGSCGVEPEPGSNLKMDCETGFGSGVWVTGVFGLAVVGEVVRLAGVYLDVSQQIDEGLDAHLLASLFCSGLR